MKIPSYRDVYKKLQFISRAKWKAARRFQKVADARLATLIKQKYPKRKSAEYPRSKYPEEYAQIFAQIKPRYTILCETLLKKEIRLVAVLNFLASRQKVERTEENVVYECSSGSYTSQGFGAVTYARNDVRGKSDLFQSEGIPFRIEEEKQSHGGTNFKLIAETDAAGFDQLKRRPIDLVEIVRLCWKRGSNPRVSMPFLPHGFEEANGLDFFGNYLDKAAK
jgi:hypothetical protein